MHATRQPAKQEAALNEVPPWSLLLVDRVVEIAIAVEASQAREQRL
jgi:hypothetical protein